MSYVSCFVQVLVILYKLMLLVVLELLNFTVLVEGDLLFLGNNGVSVRSYCMGISVEDIAEVTLFQNNLK